LDATIKIEATNILIVTDDISLPFGVLRMRKKGSDGGHNGLKDITSVLGNNNYSRLRFGVGNDFPRGKQVEFVLSNFTDLDNQSIEERIDLAIMMIQGFVTIGIDQTMSEFNGK
jgi:PTH1 family peptidyl-tRNA hydrolase